MLATRQKIDTINTAIGNLLSDGIYPTLAAIFDKVRDLAKDRPWGKPKATLRPAIENQLIGGADGCDVERTYEEIRSDLTTFYHELVDSADRALNNYWVFTTQKEVLKRRLLHLIQSSESVINTFADGGALTFQDTFNSADLTDLSQTTAALDLDSGWVTLPTSLNALEPISLSDAIIASETYPTTKPHGWISDALTDMENTGWYASLDGRTYTCIIKLTSAAAAREANGLFVSPLAPMSISVSWSNDLHNFYPLVSEHIRQDKSWAFAPIKVAALKIEITGNDVGIRRLKLLKVGHENAALFQSVPHIATDMFGKTIMIDAVKLLTDQECPPKTTIDYYVQPLFPGAPPGAWVKVGNQTTWLSSSTSKTLVLCGSDGLNQLRPEPTPPGCPRQFYYYPLGDDPIVETGRLTKGGDPDPRDPDTGGRCGQFVADYYSHDWKSIDLDPNHSPSPQDWISPGATTKGYVRPVTLDKHTSAPDALQTDAPTMVRFKNLLAEATIVEGDSTVSRDWLVLGIFGEDDSGNPVKLMADNGNYRFTTYVYMPEDAVYSRKPVLLYNPVDAGGEGAPVIAPFRVYLNDELVADVQAAFSASGLTDVDLSNYEVSFAYKRGWNKFEVYVYRTALAPGAVSGIDKVATNGVGIYIAGNPYRVARTNPGVRVQAHSSDETRVSEFALRQLVKPGDDNCWSWTDTAPARDLLLNYNPNPSYTQQGNVLYDGVNVGQSPVMSLTYQTAGTQRPNGLVLRAQLAREDDAIDVPRLSGYKLVVNQIGA